MARLAAQGIEGGSWEAIRRNITIPRLRALNKYWKSFPPTNELNALVNGYLPPVPKAKTEAKSVKDMIAMFGLTPGKKVSM